MAIKSLKMLSYVGAALKTILNFRYNQFNPLVLQKSQKMLSNNRNNALYSVNHVLSKTIILTYGDRVIQNRVNFTHFLAFKWKLYIYRHNLKIIDREYLRYTYQLYVVNKLIVDR